MKYANSEKRIPTAEISTNDKPNVYEFTEGGSLKKIPKINSPFAVT